MPKGSSLDPFINDEPPNWYKAVVGSHGDGSAENESQGVDGGNRVKANPAGEFKAIIDQVGEGSVVREYGGYIKPGSVSGSVYEARPVSPM